MLIKVWVSLVFVTNVPDQPITCYRVDKGVFIQYDCTFWPVGKVTDWRTVIVHG